MKFARWTWPRLVRFLGALLVSFAVLGLQSWTQARDPVCEPAPVGPVQACEAPTAEESTYRRGIGASLWPLVIAIGLGGLGWAALTFKRRQWVGRIPIE